MKMKTTQLSQTMRRTLGVVAASMTMLSVLPASAAAIEGCPTENGYLYHFGFSDWRKNGTGWQARDSDYLQSPSGLSVFLNLTEEEYQTMNAARSAALGETSVVLRVKCDASYSKKLKLTASPVEAKGWVAAGAAKHAVLNINVSRPDAQQFNQTFQNELIDHSSVMATER